MLNRKTSLTLNLCMFVFHVIRNGNQIFLTLWKRKRNDSRSRDYENFKIRGNLVTQKKSKKQQIYHDCFYPYKYKGQRSFTDINKPDVIW